MESSSVSEFEGVASEHALTRTGIAFKGLPNVKLYPSVGMKKQPTVQLKANFGQSPFVFDIDAMVKVGLNWIDIYGSGC